MTESETTEADRAAGARKANRRVLALFLGAAVLGAFFVWGFFAHRNRIFPYSLIRSRPRGRVEVTAKTPHGDPLIGIPYVAGTFDPRTDLKGVIAYDPARTEPGYNLWCSGFTDQAFLMDMSGNIVHEWWHPSANWIHVTVLRDGGLLAIARDVQLTRLDRASNVVWRFVGRAHHDLWVRPDDTIYLLTRRTALEPRVHETRHTLEDEVVVLSPEGRELRRFSVLDTMLRSRFRGLLPSVSHREWNAGERAEIDILHTNHVEVFDGSLAHLSPLYADGNILLSMRVPNAVVILDPTGREVLWLWGPNNLIRQHHPSLLPDGRILIFDNRTEASRIVEMDPLTCRITWTWEAPGFFTRSRGSAQRLPNGNTLITESDSGYVHEVTREGETVWRFANPDFTNDGKRRGIWRMRRLPAEALPFLESE